MKSLLIAASLWLSLMSPASAASVDVPDSSAALPGVAQATTALLVDNGLRLRPVGGGKYRVTARAFHCDQRSNGPLPAENRFGGLPSLACRIHAKNIKDTHSGRGFGDRHALLDILGNVSTALPSVQFSDCASGGYCGTFAKLISCTVDTHIENFTNGGRWSCRFVDGQ